MAQRVSITGNGVRNYSISQSTDDNGNGVQKIMATFNTVSGGRGGTNVPRARPHAGRAPRGRFASTNAILAKINEPEDGQGQI